MGKTFDESLIDTAIISMSMIDPEDMEDKTSEEFASLRRIQQGCHSELSNKEDFPFNKYTKNTRIARNMPVCCVPDGKITQVRLCYNNSIIELKHDPNIALLGNEKGVPEIYAVVYNSEKIIFYPAPDRTYNIAIDYVSSKNVILEDETLSYIIQENSTLKMPEKFQHLYFDALEYYVLYEYMRKVSNPRFEPTYKIFQDKWRTFLKGCNTVDSETMFTI